MGLAHRYLWIAFHRQQKYADALGEAKTYFTVTGDKEIADALARGSAEAGYEGAMRQAAETLAARARLRYVQPTVVAGLFAYASEKGQALQWLEKAYEAHDSWLVFLKDDPRFDSLHSEPRFQDLVRRMNFPQ